MLLQLTKKHICLLIYTFIHLFIYSSVYLFNCPLTYSLIDLFIYFFYFIFNLHRLYTHLPSATDHAVCHPQADPSGTLRDVLEDGNGNSITSSSASSSSSSIPSSSIDITASAKKGKGKGKNAAGVVTLGEGEGDGDVGSQGLTAMMEVSGDYIHLLLFLLYPCSLLLFIFTFSSFFYLSDCSTSFPISLSVSVSLCLSLSLSLSFFRSFFLSLSHCRLTGGPRSHIVPSCLGSFRLMSRTKPVFES